MSELAEIPLVRNLEAPIPELVNRLAAEGQARSRKIDCFDFVSSSVEHVWRTFAALPPGHLCELGSGIGIMTGIARFVGHRATGIEINAELAAAAQQLLADFSLDCEILHGSYFERIVDADYYFVYCWPGQVREVERHFLETASANSKLLICHGAEDIRCKVRDSSPHSSLAD